MKNKLLLVLTLPALSIACVHAKVPAPAATPTLKAHALAAPTPGLVTINAATRNSRTAAATVLLANDKKALLPIVLSDQAGAGTKAVAAELAEILEEMSGAKFEVRTGDGTSGIVLGTTQEFSAPDLKEVPTLTILVIDTKPANGGAFEAYRPMALQIGGDPAYDWSTDRHLEGTNVAFVDGHLKWMKVSDAFYTPADNRETSVDPKWVWNRK